MTITGNDQFDGESVDSDDRLVDELEAALDRVTGLTAEYAREWQQFACWAIAHGRSPLPASAATFLAYLDAYPGTLTTQRGRASAITAAHRRARRRLDDPLPITPGRAPRVGLPSPAEAEAVRRVLRPGAPARPGQCAVTSRAARLAQARADLEPRVALLPAVGWPEALTGRRDALVLHLAAAGLSWDTIAGLRQRDIHFDDTIVAIGSQPLVELPATGDPDICPVAVMRRWSTVLAHAPRATGHIELQHLLTTDDEPALGLLPEWREQPLLTRFDDRGFADGYIDELAPLTPSEIIDIVTSSRGLALPVTTVSGELDNDAYERGIAARHHAHAVGRDLDELLTTLEARIDAINADLGWNAHGQNEPGQR